MNQAKQCRCVLSAGNTLSHWQLGMGQIGRNVHNESEANNEV